MLLAGLKATQPEDAELLDSSWVRSTLSNTKGYSSTYLATVWDSLMSGRVPKTARLNFFLRRRPNGGLQALLQDVAYELHSKQAREFTLGELEVFTRRGDGARNVRT